jgi:DNA polymerase
LTARLVPEAEEAVRARIAYFRDLGVFDFYRREGCAPGATLTATVTDTELDKSNVIAAVSLTEDESAAMLAAIDLEPAPFMPRAQVRPQPQPVLIEAATAVAPKAAALKAISDDIGQCTRCALHKGRHSIVFGDGDANARLMFVGEGPGADEDAQGLPFVGRAGQLLNNMINAMGLRRDQVYIANIVKCRPPQNRVPEPVEANTCAPFLFRQIDVIQPEVVVALGSTAATYLLGGKSPLAALRGRIHYVRGVKLIVTYHPAYLLRDPRQKKEAWADLQIAMAELGLKAPAK